MYIQYVTNSLSVTTGEERTKKRGKNSIKKSIQGKRRENLLAVF